MQGVEADARRDAAAKRDAREESEFPYQQGLHEFLEHMHIDHVAKEQLFAILYEKGDEEDVFRQFILRKGWLDPLSPEAAEKRAKDQEEIRLKYAALNEKRALDQAVRFAITTKAVVEAVVGGLVEAVEAAEVAEAVKAVTARAQASKAARRAKEGEAAKVAASKQAKTEDLEKQKTETKEDTEKRKMVEDLDREKLQSAERKERWKELERGGIRKRDQR